MGLPADFSGRVTVEDLQALDDLLLIARRRAVAHVVENLGANGLVLVLGQVEKTVPEVRLVRPDLTRAHLLSGAKANRSVLVPSHFNDGVDVLGLSNLVDELVDIFRGGLLRLLLRVDF